VILAAAAIRDADGVQVAAQVGGGAIAPAGHGTHQADGRAECQEGLRADRAAGVSALPDCPDLVLDFDQAIQRLRPSSPSAALIALPIVIHSLPGRLSLGSQASAAAIPSGVPLGSLEPHQVLLGASATIDVARSSSGINAQAASKKAWQAASSTAGSRSSGTSSKLASGHV
jgi:hypothetical protein